YRLTPFGATLLPGPGSMLPLARYLLDDSVLLPLAQLDTSVRSGQPTLAQDPQAGWYAQYPERARLMDGAMAVYSGLGLPALLEAYDFSSYATLTDVGGGVGHVLAGILAHYPNASGTLFDMPATTERAVRHLAGCGLQGRYAVAAGDMLETVPGGARLYVLGKVLNNWDDAHCVRILRNIRRAMDEDARLIVIEGVVADASYAAEDAFRDLLLLACSHGGRLRTAAELRGLGGEAGLALLRVIPTSSAFSILEFAPGAGGP
ncbi:MAG TPA: methyltransferase, partial [Duganella sp.]|nr:methyltransferase [Duganella sp.]